MKKLLSVFFCLSFISVLVSCSTAPAPETVPEYDVSVEDNIDLGGRKIVSAIVKDYFFEGEDNTLGYINNTVLADLAIQRLKDVEKRFNIDLVNEFVVRAGNAAYLDVASGIGQYDYIQEESFYLVEYLPTGTFVNFFDVEELDCTDSEKWGKPNILESMMYDGGLYGIYPAAHPIVATNSACGVFCVDESIVTLLGAEDPRDIYERGEWTWETFEKVLPDYTSDDLFSDQTVYSLATPLDFFFSAISNSNTENHFSEAAGGKYVMNLYTNEGSEAIRKAQEWVYVTLHDNIKIIGSLGHADAIKRNDAAMYLMDSYDVLNSKESAAYLLENFGLVPAPVGPNLKPGTVTSHCSSLDFTLCIPVTAADIEVSAMVLDAIYEPFDGFETKSQIVDFLCRNYFSDPRDASVYLSFTDNMQYQYFFEKIPNMVLDGVSGSNISVTNLLESREDAVNDLIEKYAKDKKDTMKILFPEG